MKNFGKNIVLLAVVLILSYITAPYFGALYDKFSPGQLDSAFIGSRGAWALIIGFPFAFIFFLILIFRSLQFSGHKKWVGWLLVPPFIFFGSGDIAHIYLPMALALIAWGIAELVRKVFFKKQSL